VLLESDDEVALGHRRLAILDLSAAAKQPMISQSGRFVIAYNGEVYNFLELRRELEREGRQFRTETDTEVILASFEHWGADSLLRFNGMWSFAIWDRDAHSLFLSRDRFGVKPLYFTSSPHRFAFASELKAFLHLDGFDAIANPQAIEARLAGNRVDHVLLSGVEALRPGHCLEVGASGLRDWRWWNTMDHLVSVPSDLSKQAEEFRDLLFDACRLRVRSDVAAAVSLSGGLDSSSVLSALAAAQEHSGTERAAPHWRRAYIASFPGTSHDEVMHATHAAEHVHATPVVHRFSGREIREHLDDYLYQYEEIGGLPGIASWALYREMRRDGVAISLEGHGGDELLGGYGMHLLMALLRGPTVASAPTRTLDLIRTLQGLYGPHHPEPPGGTARLALLTFPFVRAAARRLLPTQRKLQGSLQRHSGSADGDERRRLGPLTSILYDSFHRESLPRILRNFDVYSMGHGVEVRVPLLDWRVVCYAFSTPDESKAGGGYAKRLLRESMRGVLPEDVRSRRDKLGYNAPITDWLTDGLADWLWDMVNEPEFLRSELWDGRALLALARAKRESGAPWGPPEMRRATTAVTAHWWLTRWLKRRSLPSHASSVNSAQSW